ncbi:MAG TPA: exodeoxyribonuclease VII small subunit [Longimicrobiales bacterium]|nr:exodeoxyribonuclease VII small subunit [Longimicrobiales bacterium]
MTEKTEGAGAGGAEDRGLEERLARLEAIVERLERDDLDLEGALALFEEGISHVREASAVLERTRLRVEKLVIELDGSVSIESVPDEG